MTRGGIRVNAVSTAIVALLAATGWARADSTTTLTSPGDTVAAVLSIAPDGHLQYTLQRDGARVLEASSLGVTVDGVDLGTGVVSMTVMSVDESNVSYPWRGVKSTATDHAVEYALAFQRSGAGDVSFEMVWRLYDDGCAYRYRIPGSGSRTVSGEASAWTVPDGSLAWYQNNLSNYEGIWQSGQIGQVNSWVGPPVVFRLPGSGGAAAGYAALTEACLRDYGGMKARLTPGSRTATVAFLDGGSWPMDGGSVTPWRVTITSAALDGMVNSTLVPNLCPPPAPDLAYPDWIRPGRCLWSWWAFGTDRDDQDDYIDAAQSLGFDYVLWDEGWEYWSTSSFNSLLSYAKNRGIGVWLWKKWYTLGDSVQRDAFFGWIDGKNTLQGEKVIVGVKVDFMDSETPSLMQWYEDILQHAATYELMINFHGANKPTGLTRTYPNEVTREGVRGLEYYKFGVPLPCSHNAALPFTRLLAGHADYTPVTFWNERMGDSSYAHQLAMAFVLTSPLTHWADDPVNYLSSTARDVIEAAPTVWDETIVLPPSEIGELALMARRAGSRWFLAAVHGSTTAPRTVQVPLSFLSAMAYDAVLLGDLSATPYGFDRNSNTLTSSDTLTLALRPGGGYVAMFTPAPDAPMIRVEPSTLAVQTTLGQEAPDQTFTVGNVGVGTLNYTISVHGDDAEWLHVEPDAGSTTTQEDVITVSFASVGLAWGVHEADLTVNDPAASNVSQTVHVTLTIEPPPHVWCDFDIDGDVDQADFGHLQRCLSGPSVPQEDAACQDAKFDTDADVDQAELAVLLRCMSGAGVPAAMGCDATN